LVDCYATSPLLLGHISDPSGGIPGTVAAQPYNTVL
jgi:hypothetical protein